MKPMDRIQKKQRAHPLIQILRRPPKGIQRITLREQVSQTQSRHRLLKRCISQAGIGARDDGSQSRHNEKKKAAV
jgi:hypothetical protein